MEHLHGVQVPEDASRSSGSDQSGVLKLTRVTELHEPDERREDGQRRQDASRETHQSRL